MASWGTAIFSDDTACDVRDDFKDYIGDGYSSSEATKLIITEWQKSLDDSEEESVFWLSLAVTQWNIGRLDKNVKDKAISIIDLGSDLDRWEGKSRTQRSKVLEKAKEKIESSQPAEKKIQKIFRSQCNWEVGELIAYKTISEKKVLFRVIGHHEDKGGKSPICELLNWQGDKIPNKLRLRFMGIKKRKYPNGHIDTQFGLGQSTENQFPKERIERTGIVLKPSQQAGPYMDFPYAHLDERLKEFFGIE